MHMLSTNLSYDDNGVAPGFYIVIVQVTQQTQYPCLMLQREQSLCACVSVCERESVCVCVCVCARVNAADNC